MIVVRYRDVATALAVDMIVVLMHRVTGWLTFVVMTVMLPMEMAVMQVVDMVAMWDRHMPATVSMSMIVIDVLSVSAHGVIPSEDGSNNRHVLVRCLERRPDVRTDLGPLGLGIRGLKPATPPTSTPIDASPEF